MAKLTNFHDSLHCNFTNNTTGDNSITNFIKTENVLECSPFFPGKMNIIKEVVCINFSNQVWSDT